MLVSSQPLRSAYMRSVIAVHAARPLSSNPKGDGPRSPPPPAAGSSATSWWAPTRRSTRYGGALDATGAEHAAVAHDGAGLDDGAGADSAAVDHRPGTHDCSVLDDEVVVRQQVQDGVLQDLDVASDAHRSVRVTDDLDAGTDD